MAEPITYLRKKDDPYVYRSSPQLLENPDLFPCDREGNFISSGTKSMERLDSEFVKEKEKLYELAKELGISNYKRMRLATLIKRIVSEQIALERAQQDG
jgi:hypothetical protein